MENVDKLAYKDKFVKQLVQDLSAYSEGSCVDAIPQIISGEENYVILKVSLEEWTKLFSSVYSGADFCYPAESDNVRWILQRAVECPVSICDLIIDCITNNPATLQAIVDGLQASQEFNQFVSNKVEGLTSDQLTGPLIAGSCDEAVLAGKMMALVTRLDTNNIDALETVFVGLNDEELISNMIEAIPVFGELPFDDLIELGVTTIENFGENYAAASTIARREALAKDLYCLALEKIDCVLTYADLFTFFNDRVSSGLTLDSLILNIAQWIFAGDFGTDDLVFNGMMAFQISTIRVGKEFLGVSAPTIGALTRDASPSTIWEEWGDCGDPIPPECDEINTTTPRGWSPNASDEGVMTSTGMAPVLYVPDGLYYLKIRMVAGSISEEVSEFRLMFNEPIANVTLYKGSVAAGSIMGSIGGTPSDELICNSSSHGVDVTYPFSNSVAWQLRFVGDTVPSTFRVNCQIVTIAP